MSWALRQNRTTPSQYLVVTAHARLPLARSRATARRPDVPATRKTKRKRYFAQPIEQDCQSLSERPATRASVCAANASHKTHFLPRTVASGPSSPAQIGRFGRLTRNHRARRRGCYNLRMVGTSFLRIIQASTLAFVAFAATAGTANAQLMEPDGFGPIPTDPRKMCDGTTAGSGLATGGTIGCTGTGGNINDFACCDNTLDNMSLIGLFKYYESDAAGNILINYLTDAKTQPATFNPLCSITGNMVMHGGGCYVDFGWYCVDPNNSYTNQPKIHPLVTALQTYTYAKQTNPPFPTAWQNNDGAFLPKTGYTVAGTPLTDVANDPDFQNCPSHQIGFAIQGNTTQECQTTAGCACSQNKFTEQALNQINTASGKPYIDAVIYASKNVPGRFYIAIEDLPTSPTAFAAPYSHAGAIWNADGDFNDFVYTVEGVVCQGGGQLCTVPGQQGICATGVTSCVDSTSTAAPTCDPVFKPQVETCNAIDDDCNGLIDDGPNLCSVPGQVCLKGTCVSPCAAVGEFACPGGLVCVGAGYCVDPACASVTCAADQKCVNQNGTGVCVGGCTGVTCTAGEQCVAGVCVDLCAARTAAGLPACPTNFVCQNGACVPNCTCLACPDPTNQECQSDSSKPGFGRCVATGCSGTTCPTGQLCIPGGTCIDPCNPNPCATGQTCTPATQYDPSSTNQYSCTNPNVAAGGGSSTGGAPVICLGCTQAGSGATGNTGNTGNAAGPGNGNGTGAASPGNSSTSGMGCGCRMVGGTPGRRLALTALLGVGLMVMHRRRRALPRNVV